MRKALLFICACAIVMTVAEGCSADRVAFHNRNGRVKYARGKRMLQWFAPAGSGYDKYSKRNMKRWDKSFR